MVKNFKEWSDAVTEEIKKLRACQDYLNPDGISRLRTFCVLDNAAAFCSTAAELLNWIETDQPTKFELEERAALCSRHAHPAMRRLRQLAEAESER